MSIIKFKLSRAEKYEKDFKDWILDLTKGYNPGLAATPTGFDAMFIHDYFDRFHIENPFGYGGEDIGSMYRGLVHNKNASIKDMPEWPKQGLPHNALEDAKIQARMLEIILKKMRE